MACEDLKAKHDALEAQLTQLTKLLNSEPPQDRAGAQARLKALSAEAFAAGRQYAACLAEHAPPAPPVTRIAVRGPQSTITVLGPQSAQHASQWNQAISDQMGVIGNDFRAPEEIGSAAF